MTTIYKKFDIDVSDRFIEKFANKYVEQRSVTSFNIDVADQNFYFNRTGFDSKYLQSVIQQHVVTDKFKVTKTGNIDKLRNIYRSDLGELLLTYFFEEKLDIADRYLMPLKNISNRELCDMAGRGLDAVGYRIENDNKIRVLIGEAKVSEEKKSPPTVLHTSHDSMYITQLKYKNDKDELLKKLADYNRKLSNEHAAIIGTVLVSLQNNIASLFDLTFGCCLVRDYTCVNETSDFGKLKSDSISFSPYSIHFPILSFANKTIEETVHLFYDKVQSINIV